MSTPRPPSDWPRSIDDCDDTLTFVRTTFFGQPIPRLPADQSIDALLGSPQSTIRERRPVEAATTEILEVRHAV